ncbi:type II secretion system protein GspM [Magnetospira sp. QH-2]|uniref:type II secretion system protein GspM n=1 Tax=Magnetospira sp. (strain QH-2) TaxID=1288970 RepID=UPI0003E80BB7|nr:type II secretion system protein GspM [Magnetospira sp. QH-2]CCQ73356.1 Exported protein of unknown function [Magnetospira sp. QH-2]
MIKQLHGPSGAVLLGILMIALAGFGVSRGLSAWHTDLDRKISHLETSVAKVAAVADRRDGLRRDLAELKQGQQNHSLLPGAGADLAAAALQDLVRQRLKDSPATLESLQVLPAGPVENFQRITLRLRLTAPVEALPLLLQQLQFGQPVVTILSLNARISHDKLRVSLDLAGFRQGARA